MSYFSIHHPFRSVSPYEFTAALASVVGSWLRKTRSITRRTTTIFPAPDSSLPKFSLQDLYDKSSFNIDDLVVAMMRFRDKRHFPCSLTHQQPFLPSLPFRFPFSPFVDIFPSLLLLPRLPSILSSPRLLRLSHPHLLPPAPQERPPL